MASYAFFSQLLFPSRFADVTHHFCGPLCQTDKIMAIQVNCTIAPLILIMPGT